MSDNWFCSDISRESGEPLMATAPHVDVWFCLEYGGLWGRSALKESDLPDSVKAHLTGAESSIPRARIELIKQEHRQPRGDYAFFVALSRETDPRLYRFTLTIVEDVLSLDLVKIAAMDPAYDQNIISQPLILTCTNGKRDKCCARNGLSVYHALVRHVGERAWQCTHLGGHRFGANIVVLPAGTYYGRVTPDDAASVIDSSSINLSHYRGRSCYDVATQAADAFLRAHIRQTALAATVLFDAQQLGHEEWLIRFRGGDHSYSVRLRREPAGFATFVNCGDADRTDVSIFKPLEIAEI